MFAVTFYVNEKTRTHLPCTLAEIEENFSSSSIAEMTNSFYHLSLTGFRDRTPLQRPCPFLGSIGLLWCCRGPCRVPAAMVGLLLVTRLVPWLRALLVALRDLQAKADVLLLLSLPVRCAECQQEIPSQEVISHLFLMEHLASNSEAKTGEASGAHTCTSCEDSAAASGFCLDCQDWLCQACIDAHQRVRVTKDHSIRAKDELEGDKPTATLGQKYMFCENHKQVPSSLPSPILGSFSRLVLGSAPRLNVMAVRRH